MLQIYFYANNPLQVLTHRLTAKAIPLYSLALLIQRQPNLKNSPAQRSRQNWPDRRRDGREAKLRMPKRVRLLLPHKKRLSRLLPWKLTRRPQRRSGRWQKAKSPSSNNMLPRTRRPAWPRPISLAARRSSIRGCWGVEEGLEEEEEEDHLADQEPGHSVEHRALLLPPVLPLSLLLHETRACKLEKDLTLVSWMRAVSLAFRCETCCSSSSQMVVLRDHTFVAVMWSMIFSLDLLREHWICTGVGGWLGIALPKIAWGRSVT